MNIICSFTCRSLLRALVSKKYSDSFEYFEKLNNKEKL